MFGLSAVWTKLIAAGGVLLAILAVVWRLIAYGKASGVDQQKAKEAQARDENLKKLKEAVAAGDAVRDTPDSLQSDPNNRDNR